MAAANKPHSQVAQLYQTVIEDVVNNVRESFLDDGVDEQVLQELKQIWENKLKQTKAVDSPTIGDRARPPVYTYPGQPMLYRALPTQTVQLSSTSQQARMAVPDVVYQHRSGLVNPTQPQQLFTSYQPVTVLPQPNLQISQQGRPAVGSSQTLILATSQQQQKSGNKSGPSAIIQVDGSANTPSSSSTGLINTSYNKHCKCKIKKRKGKKAQLILQVDGRGDSSSSDDDVDDDDDEDDDEDEDDEDEAVQEEEKVDEEPLNSADDDSDQDANELFDTENVVVCQYDKIHRAKAKWKFNLKYGIMNLQGKDHVFQKANGEADW